MIYTAALIKVEQLTAEPIVLTGGGFQEAQHDKYWQTLSVLLKAMGWNIEKEAALNKASIRELALEETRGFQSEWIMPPFSRATG